ncbi:MAG: hypothetical protein BHV99_03080 [Clostridium sp. 26_21]|nr:MAG: hypothetical protein BHV99_03080 [Clostridium sp. 26_21]
MQLYYEEEKNTKKSKAPIFIGIFILLLLILTVVIVYLIMYLKSNVLKVKIDGKSNSEFAKLIVQADSNGETEMYFPIRKIAKYFGYKDYSGDFKTKSEDSTKCYVDNETEIAMFTQNSDTLIISREDTPIEEFTLDKRVIEKNGELYTTIDGIEKAFNITFNYKTETKQVTIYTMEYLVQYYATKLKLEKPSEEYADKKAILNQMIIFYDETMKKYGVMDVTTGKYVLENKYDSISYLPYSSQFLVQSNKKYGVMDKNAKVKLKIAYDEIKIGDNTKGLYVVKENDLYGVVDNSGNVIIQSNYNQIGVDLDTFGENGLENQYVLVGEVIPVKRDKLWGFYNIKGEKITDLIFTEVGCNSAKVANAYPAVVIPSFKAIVVKLINQANEEKYTIINTGGQQLVTAVLDSVYLIPDASTGKNTYYITYNGNTKNAEETLSAIGYK